MKFRLLVRVLFFVILCNIEFGKSEVFDECNGVADESFVASQSDCKAYIYCMGEDSLSGECDEGQYFDPEALACDSAENVYCALDQPNAESEVEEQEARPVPEPDAELNIEDEKTTRTMSEEHETVTTTTNTITTVATTTIEVHFEAINSTFVVMRFCPLTDNTNQIVLIANNESCSDYYVCYHGNAIEMHCTRYLHFNGTTGQCDYPENVLCPYNGPITSKCLPYITEFFPHPEKCNYFYNCIRGFLTMQQCPFYYGWDVEKRVCVQIAQAKCYKK